MWGSQPRLCPGGTPPQTSLTASGWPSSLTLLLWPLMRRVLVPSAQLTYQSVPAVVPTTPMSMLSWKTALTTAPSRVSSRSMNTELDLRGSRGSRVEARGAQGARGFWGASAFVSSGLPQARPRRGQAQPWSRTPANEEAHLAAEPLRLSSGTAPTSHRRRRRVLLPLTSRDPEHSSTPRRQGVA